MSPLTKEVVIAGGGLAGLSLAAGLRRRKVPVTVHEAGSYPRHRVCGEFISGITGRVLDELGIGDCLAAAGRRREVSWYRDDRLVMRGTLPQEAMAVSRFRLDESLCQRVRELGGRVVERSRWSATGDEGEVWAAGRLPQRGCWIGLKCHVVGLEMRSDLEMHLGSGGYVGLCPLGDGRVNVCGLFELDRSFRKKGAELLEAYLRRSGQHALADRLAEVEKDESSFCAVAGFRLGWQVPVSGRCVLGDAAGMIPPFTGNGMSMAFEGAWDALDPLEAWSRGEVGWSRTVEVIRRRARRRFRRRLSAAALMHRMLLHPGGQRVFDALGRSGLVPFRPLLSLVR